MFFFSKAAVNKQVNKSRVLNTYGERSGGVSKCLLGIFYLVFCLIESVRTTSFKMSVPKYYVEYKALFETWK